MGTHGRRGIARWLHGSVATRVASITEAPLLLVRAREVGSSSLCVKRLAYLVPSYARADGDDPVKTAAKVIATGCEPARKSARETLRA